MGNLIRHADTSIPGLPSDVAGADVPGELAAMKEIDEILEELYERGILMGIGKGRGVLDSLSAKAEAKDLLMQRLCSYIVSVQHVALLEGMKRKTSLKNLPALKPVKGMGKPPQKIPGAPTKEVIAEMKRLAKKDILSEES